MKNFLNTVRNTKNPIPLKQQIINTASLLLIGVVLGIISKFLDTTPANDLPFIMNYLDISNFLGRFAIWLLLALGISVYSNSSVRSSINVFVFFAGMVTSYYLYSKFIAGFFPVNYAMIWGVFTIVSPIFAFICWYAKGKSKIAFILSVPILAVLFNTTFIYGSGYFEIRSILELITFICAVIVLRRTTIKDTMIMLVLTCGMAATLDLIVPFHFG